MIVLLTLLTTIIVLIDVTWQPIFSFREAIPDWTLVWVICVAIILPRKSFGVAFWAGLWQDLLVGDFFGTRAVSLLLIAGIVVLLKDHLFQYKLATWLTILVLATCLYPCLVTWSVFEFKFEIGKILYNLLAFASCLFIVSIRLFRPKGESGGIIRPWRI